jgi:hypothetical protein
MGIRSLYLFTGGLLILFTGTGLWQATNPAFTPPDPQSVGLLLRSVGHEVLQAAGDSTTRIPPVRRSSAHTFVLTLPSGFEYDLLPGVLAAALRKGSVRTDYEVAVRACGTPEVILGYRFRTSDPDAEVPCVGREQLPGCSEITVTFLPATRNAGVWWWAAGLLAMLAGLGGYVWKKRTLRPVPAAEAPVAVSAALPDLDLANLEIRFDHTRHALTFREAKLLDYFFRHPNELLPREQILKAVWEDEGVMVDRSLDVFVSRLRKILALGSQLRIENVRGVGYRLVKG